MTEELENYILSHIDPEPELLRKVNRDTHVMCLYSNMCSGHLQGRMLKMICRMIRPKRILELGTFTGYSALCLAEGMPDGSQLHTIEINDELADFISGHFGASKYSDSIHLHIGDAAQIIPKIDEQWDLVFIDANKRTYIEYFDLIFPRVRPGGFIIADNTLWYGKVSDSSCHDPQTAGILAFNDYVNNDPRVENVILPLRDGLTIIYKKPEFAQSAPDK